MVQIRGRWRQINVFSSKLNEIEVGRARVLDSNGKRAVTRFGRATALRWTSFGLSLMAAAGLSAFAAEALAAAAPKIPFPKPRPIARSVVPKTTAIAKPLGQPVSLD